MRVALLRARAEWRRRWPSLVALTVLAGLVGAVGLGALAGARRTRSTVDRFIATTRTFDAFVSFNDDSFASVHAASRLPELEVAAGFSGFGGFTASGSYMFFLAPIDEHLGTDVVRDLVVDGRRPAPGRPFEVAVSRTIADANGLRVGDPWTIRTVSAAQSACFVLEPDSPPPPDDCGPLYELFDGDNPDLSVLQGPELAFDVVPITRGPFDAAQSDASTLVVVANQGLFEEVGSAFQLFPGILAVYAPGVTDREFEAALEAAVGPGMVSDLEPSSAVTDVLHTTSRVLAAALALFATVATALGLVAVAQAVTRHVAGSEPDRAVLRALGFDRRARAVDALVPILPVALGAAALAVVGAWCISPAMPIASARELEPNPGLRFDAPVLLGGAALLAALVLGFAVIGVAVSARAASGVTAPGRARGAVRGRRVEASLGVWFALDRGPRRSIPVRTAMSGAALGVCGVVAASSFGTALARLVDQPARHGYGWDATVSGCLESDDCSGQREVEAEQRVAEQAAVTGAARIWFEGRVPVAGRSEPAFGQRVVEAGAGFTIVDGRAPLGDDEVALGAKTLARHGLDLGDRLELAGREVEVVGQAVFPAGDDGFPLAEGVLFSDGGLRASELELSSSVIAVRLAPRADRDAALDALAALNGGQRPELPVLPVEVDDLRQVERLPALLAAFLIAVALLAVGHAVTVTVRRRRRDLGIVRALGLTSGGVGAVVRWQAAVMSSAGVVAGVPLGLLLGRFVWDRVADSYGVADDPAWPWTLLAAVTPVTVAMTLLLTLGPARRAVRQTAAVVLRTE
jgi:hypothetical protein